MVARVIQSAINTFEETLAQVDPGATSSEAVSQIMLSLDSVVTTASDKEIDTYTCESQLQIILPPQIAALHQQRVFRVVAFAKLGVRLQGKDIVAPLTYTVYRSRGKTELMVEVEGLQALAIYIERAYRAGAFTAAIQPLPDLRAGMTLYNAESKHLHIEPVANGSLQFYVSYDSAVCQPWRQTITEERGDTLIYDNKEFGCAATFNRVGEMVLVDHQGCNRMIVTCYPDGVYRKQ
ncbi:MAG: hypothetical protein ACREUQ_08835 [Burkholderiales bacterium]